MAKLPKANKELGQHFLRDQKVIETITTDFEDECDVIVEVGPGPAVLSKFLATKGKPYFIVEKDLRFKEQLIEHIAEEQMYFTDALQFNWPEFIQERGLEDKKIWLVSNLPYNVSVPLFMGFSKIPQIKYLSLMFQKEVGDKTYFRPQAKNQMGSLLAISMNYFESKQLIKVLPGAFIPPPKVDSVVVTYERREEPEIPLAEFKEYESFLRNIYQFKRKQLGSLFKSFVPKDRIPEYIEITGIDSRRRGETLTIEEIYHLYKSFKNMK